MSKHSKIRGPKEGILVVKSDTDNTQAAPIEKKGTGLLLLSIVGNTRCQKEFLEASFDFGLRHYKTLLVLFIDEPHAQNLRGKTIAAGEEPSLIHGAHRLRNQYLTDNLPHLLAPFTDSSYQRHHNPDRATQARIRDQQALAFKKKYHDPNEWINVLNQMAVEHRIPIQYYCWAQWLAQTPSIMTPEQIDSLYANTPILRDALTSSIDKFVKASFNRANNPKDTAMVTLDIDEQNELKYIRARGYLQAESYPTYFVAKAKGVNDILYSGKEPDVCKATHKYLNPEKTQTNWVHLDFKREYPIHKDAYIDDIRPETASSGSSKHPAMSFQAGVTQQLAGFGVFSIPLAQNKNKYVNSLPSLHRAKSAPAFLREEMGIDEIKTTPENQADRNKNKPFWAVFLCTDQRELNNLLLLLQHSTPSYATSLNESITAQQKPYPASEDITEEILQPPTASPSSPSGVRVKG